MEMLKINDILDKDIVMSYLGFKILFKKFVMKIQRIFYSFFIERVLYLDI